MFEAFVFTGESVTSSKNSGSQREREKSGKRVRGENEGSSFHLDAPNNAARNSMISVVMERGTPTVRIELEEMQRNLIVDTAPMFRFCNPACRDEISEQRQYHTV